MVPESILKIGITRKEWGNMDIHATLHWDRIIQLQIIYWHTHSTCLCCKTSHRQSRQPTAWGSVCTFLKGAYRMMHFYWVLFFGCTWWTQRLPIIPKRRLPLVTPSNISPALLPLQSPNLMNRSVLYPNNMGPLNYHYKLLYRALSDYSYSCINPICILIRQLSCLGGPHCNIAVLDMAI